MNNFLTIEWNENEHNALMLCLKCEESFNVDPCGEDNLVWCAKKTVLVPQCPNCGINDIDV